VRARATSAIQALGNVPPRRPRSAVASIFLAALVVLLLGYQFMGRGFAHLGVPPLYVGEVVLVLGLFAATVVVVRRAGRIHLPPIAWLLIAFMVLGAARTIPFLGIYGVDALRDAVLWGYGLFALVIFVVADRMTVFGARRLYGWVLPVFALWLPISYYLFRLLSVGIEAHERGSEIPLIFFKSGDMAVHIVGAFAFLIVGSTMAWTVRSVGWRMLLSIPILWTAFIAASTNRGALLTLTFGLLVVAGLGALLRRSRNWVPVAIVAGGALIVGGTSALVGSVSGTAGEVTPQATSSPVATELVGPDTSMAPRSQGCDPQPASRSLVANPGFELGTLNDGTIEGWSTWAGLYNIVEDGAFEGEQYASIQNTGEPGSANIVSSEFAFEAGEDISVTLHARALDGDPILATYVVWSDRSGAPLGSVMLQTLYTEGRATWQESAGYLTAPEGTARARIQIYEIAGLSAVAIDEVIVEVGDFVQESSATVGGRAIGLEQIVENIRSIFTNSADGGLEGSKEFRLQWWGAIVDYTVFGKHFWGGKGFGVNLADDDGFQANEDGSLRAPHNSHLTALARMGVPGFFLWVVLQGAFALGLTRAVVVNRRAGATVLAGIAAVILAYWTAMMINTSFDPYLEGPQGGIWFWTLFGLGMLVMQLTPGPMDVAPNDDNQTAVRGTWRVS